MDITEQFPINSVLVTRFCDGSLRFFRVTGHTLKKVRVHQIVPYYSKKDGLYRVDDTCRLIQPEDNRSKYTGLATIRSDGTLIWNYWHLQKWHTNSFDERVDREKLEIKHKTR